MIPTLHHMTTFSFNVIVCAQFEDVAEKDDLMGAEDTPKRGFFSTRTTFKNRSTIFTLGSRDTVLTTELEDPIIVVPHAQKTEKRVSETFRSTVKQEIHACILFMHILA